jgi:hypothetical protein
MMICRRGKDAAGAVQRARYLSVYAPLILTPKSHVTLLEESGWSRKLVHSLAKPFSHRS